MSKAKPVKPARKKSKTDQQLENLRAINEDDIARRAYALYLARQAEHGHDVEDWLRAERELFQRVSN